jgi:hypothetical protein
MIAADLVAHPMLSDDSCTLTGVQQSSVTLTWRFEWDRDWTVGDGEMTYSEPDTGKVCAYSLHAERVD